MSEHFSDLCQRYISRRNLMKTGVGALALAYSAPALLAAGNVTPTGDFAPSFLPLPHQTGNGHKVTSGYNTEILISWGDTLDGQQPATLPLSHQQQSQNFGYNNDFIAYMPLQGSQRGLLCVNHEYGQPHMMFPGYENYPQAVKNATDFEIRSEMMSVGHSVIEVEKSNGQWRVVTDSTYKRRITASTETLMDGPAAGDDRLKTRDDPSGKKILGVIGCCSGGTTPWGTVLIAEENFGDFFSGDIKNLRKSHPKEWAAIKNYGVGKEAIHWARSESRFNVEKELNEINRFGWIVEFDPYNPESVPIKRSSLGRFEHEAATCVYQENKPVVVYSGDDGENQFLYRFISSGLYQAQSLSANKSLLSSGTLYCAKFNDDGTGQWLPLLHGEGPLTPENGFDGQADVLIDCRRAAKLIGATPMDRPEDMETNPETGRVYVALTKNKKKDKPNAANPKTYNPTGHILEILPPGFDKSRDHLSRQFSWSIFLTGGNPYSPGNSEGRYGGKTGSSDWFANPDNLAFDIKSRLWIATDGCPDFGFNDGLWCTATTGEFRAYPRHFFSCPRGAEMCGPAFTPDGRTLFVAVQHPGSEEGSNFLKPSTRWPDFNPSLPPRPSVVAITKEDGGIIGD